MVHGLETMKAMNDAAAGASVADVKFVMDQRLHEAVYVDGKLLTCEGSKHSIALGTLAVYLRGRIARITEVELGGDFKHLFSNNYADLIPYIDTESPQ